MPRDLLLFSPEAAVLLGALATFIVSLTNTGGAYRWTRRLATIASALGCAAALATLGETGEPFSPGMYRVDTFSQLLKAGLGGGLALVLLIAPDIESARPSTRADTPFFLLLSTVGMMLLVSATELLTLYVALELAAYGLYIAVALHRDPRRGSEAGAKYVLFGAASSAITLYGVSLVFGATGTTYIGSIAVLIDVSGHLSPLLLTGFILMLAGFLFKLAVFPFHFWAPDVYQAAPHQIVAFVATASKLAGIGVLTRAIGLIVDTPELVAQICGVLAVLSMTLGNLAALVQRDIKRLLGYSAVAHAGYLMIGYGATSTVGIASVLFYGVAYLAMGALAFSVVCCVGRNGENPTLNSIAGLHHRSPLLALFLLTSIFALAGIPPTAGFAGKWFLFAAAMQRGQFSLVLIAAINSTVGLYYYLIVIKAAYLEPSDAPALSVSLGYRLAGYLSLAVTLFAGVYPGPLWNVSMQAARQVLGQ